ncbi:MAG: molybdopterin-dependent oxidoreductase [Proteobacteria bacterium]|nr:molybdopterin-dependent oxidoreductase [Pseudomonadota bacterium]
MSRLRINRRTALRAGVGGFGGLLLSGCDAVVSAPGARRLVRSAESLSFGLQRALLSGQRLAREFSPAQISPTFRLNGSVNPQNAEYVALREANFSNYRLIVDGLVGSPQSLSLAQLMLLPSRSQITRHDCVEGWSAIGKWTGVPLHLVLARANVLHAARFIVFECFDLKPAAAGVTPYYESIDLFDAFHPQTMLAYAMNDAPLAVGHGAPLRLRVERQLGYKQAKYIRRIRAVATLEGIFGGNGGYWEDAAGYEWYAGI